MCLLLGLFVTISLVLGAFEIGLIIQPLLNMGLGFYVAHNRACQFRWADNLKIIMASGTVLAVTVALMLASPMVLGPLMGLINALISVVYIPYRLFQIFPKGGRVENPSFVEDLKDIIDERKKSL